ncbi:SCP2 sterol-binding domain-containing protein [Janthinobacterium sp. 17J80-10]|uniref:ubiquinone anaerobic biosynthesis accessory factor UbiT n=1 Tax=Janthinobacterium sp. 17J80-10 TaxID=2497863 RepID=UPI001005660D|nr:SCP2 sterol-binding domain-containing protein [Janthinobacterium sp. 17J80-10]QAU35351.1 sterol-binding protein [Janthinobacterium sp. 17J80-10]
MNENRMTLPQPVGKLLSILPAYPGSLLFATALNLALRDSLPLDVKRSLEGKRLCIRVTDAQLAFHFQWARGSFVASAADGKPDLLIAASAQDFLLLARRQEDPDTLFFSRRLIMEGDTDLGLLVKNTLDAIEMPVFDPRRLEPARLLARFTSRSKN